MWFVFCVNMHRVQNLLTRKQAASLEASEEEGIVLCYKAGARGCSPKQKRNNHSQKSRQKEFQLCVYRYLYTFPWE